MATYDELEAIVGTILGDPLRNRLRRAIAIKAQTLVDGAPTSTQLVWANEALSSPISKVDALLNYMISANKGAAVSIITGASDTLIQTNVDNAVTALVP